MHQESACRAIRSIDAETILLHVDDEVIARAWTIDELAYEGIAVASLERLRRERHVGIAERCEILHDRGRVGASRFRVRHQRDAVRPIGLLDAGPRRDEGLHGIDLPHHRR